MHGSEVAVVGGGVVGLSAAWRLAQAGRSVTVLDPEPGRGASWAAAGMLAPVTEVAYGEEALLRLNVRASLEWPGFAESLAAESGRDPGYVACGSLMVARDADDAAALRAVMTFQRELGLQVDWVRSNEVRELEPHVAPGVRGAVRVDGDHQVDNRALLAALQEAVARRGVRLVRSAVRAVTGDEDRVTGVETAAGEVHHCDWVVVAAGCRSGLLAGLPEAARPPVRPVKGQLLHLRAAAPLITRTLRGRDAYLVQRPDGRLVVGATVEERGFDEQVTAGAVRDLLHAAWELLPGIDECAFVEAVAGLRPGTPDNAPLIGQAARPGLVVATGHYRNGILLAPVTAHAVAAVIAGDGLPPDVAPFAADRFVGSTAP